MMEVLLLCLELTDKKGSFLPSSFQPLAQAGRPGREKAGPGLKEQWCFFHIINYDDSNPPPLLPLAYTVLPSFPALWAKEAVGTG